MKYLLLFGLVAIVLVSGCIDFGGTQATFGFSEITDNPDMYMKIRTSSDEIKSGRYVQMEFVIENKGDMPLNNVRIDAYDQCLFTGDKIKEFSEIKPNRTATWNWKWQAGNTDFDQECTVRFRTTYNAQTITTATTAVLDESEYYTREDQGKLGEITARYTEKANSLRIGFTFSESQPWLAGERILVYLNYNDVGGGMIKELKKTNVTIEVTPNLADGECSSYTIDSIDENLYVLSSPLKFVNKRAPSTTCAFVANAEQPIDSGHITVTANYKYQFDNSLLLKVTPR